MTSGQDPVFFSTIQAQDDLGQPVPISFYDIQPTAYGGRGAFASMKIILDYGVERFA